MIYRYGFKKKPLFVRNEKKQFLENFHKEPNIHIVFKDEKKLKKFEDKLFKTSKYLVFY